MISVPRTYPERMPVSGHLARPARPPAFRQLVVVDPGLIPNRWQSVDVAALRRRLDGPLRAGAARVVIRALLVPGSLPLAPAGPPDAPAASKSEPADKVAAVAAACIPIGRARTSRRRMLPHDAFVIVGRESAQHAGPGSANDNAPAPNGDRRRLRALMREAVLLAMLAASLAGAFYSGRIHAAQNVIVVPPPASARNILT